MKGGWFIGDFQPTVLPSNDFVIACKHYKKNDYEPAHYHRVATEYTLIAKGKVLMNNLEFGENDIIMIEKGESTDFKAVEDSTTVVVKVPSVKNDKILSLK